MKLVPLAHLAMLLLASCAATLPDPVVVAVESSGDNEGKPITLAGKLKERNGYFNLYSKNGKECVGILLTDQQKKDYRSRAGKTITLTGILEAEGCGKGGICVEHLCSPTIITRITAIR